MRKANNHQNDPAGRLVLRSAAASEAEMEAAASSPFLFKRTGARIAAEGREREQAGNWLSLFFVARRAVPAMALVALLATVLTIWSAFTAAPGANVFDEEALMGTPGSGVEQTVLAGANLSQDDVINIVVDRDYGRNGR